MFVRLAEYWVWNCDQGRHMPVLSLISELQADAAALSPLRRNATSLGRSPNRHIPFVSAWRSLFTFQWLDIPIRAAPIYSFPLCRVQSLIFFLFLFFFSLTPSCSSPFDLLTHHWVACLVSSLWRDPGAVFHIPPVCLSVCVWWLNARHYDFRNVVSCQPLIIFKQTQNWHSLSLFDIVVPRQTVKFREYVADTVGLIYFNP